MSSEFLHLSVLGPLQIQWSDNPTPIKNVGAELALLIYLACQGEPQSREKLCQLFWNGRFDKQARSNLRTLLARGQRRWASYLYIDDERVLLNPTLPLWLDVTEFQRHLAAAERLYSANNESQGVIMRRLQDAMQLYRGHFLADFIPPKSPVFEDWILQEQEKLERQAAFALQRLVHLQLLHGLYQEGLEAARRWLTLEPYNEQAHAQFMRLLVGNQQVNGALAHYQTYEQQHHLEFKLPPGPELTKLYETICTGNFKEILLIAPRLEPFTNTRVTDPPTGVTYPRIPPRPATPLIGNEQICGTVEQQLLLPTCRILTLMGPGGIGKTHVALTIAHRLIGAFRHGVAYIPLTDLLLPRADDPNTQQILLNQLATATAHALNLYLDGSESPVEQVLRYVHEKELLLIFDNFEYLLSGSAWLSQLVEMALGLTILVASRERLHLWNELVVEVSELPVPTLQAIQNFAHNQINLAELTARYASIRLFLERARHIFPKWPDDRTNVIAVAELCRLLNGIPLAIELAAVWVQHFTVNEITEAIQQDLGFLTTNVLDIADRHRSIKNTLATSWQLLSLTEQQALARLSFFTGSFGRQAAQTIMAVPPTMLASLTDKSLIKLVDVGRYEIHFLLRQFASERWQAGQLDSVEQKQVVYSWYSRYYLMILADHIADLSGQNPQVAIAKIRTDVHNIRIAWQMAVQNRELALIEAGIEGYARYLEFTGSYQEAEGIFVRLVDDLRQPANGEMVDFPQNVQDLLLRGQLFIANFKDLLGKYQEARYFAQSTITMAQLSHKTDMVVWGYLYWSRTLYHQGNLTAAQIMLEQTLRIVPKANSDIELADILYWLGLTYENIGVYEQAEENYQQSLTIYRQIGDRRKEASILSGLGSIARQQGLSEQSITYYQAALVSYQAIGDRANEAHILNSLGLGYMQQGIAYGRACQFFYQALAIYEDLGDDRGRGLVYPSLAQVLALCGDFATAQRLAHLVLKLSRERGERSLEVAASTVLSRCLYLQGHYQQALEEAEQGIALVRDSGEKSKLATMLILAADACRGLGEDLIAIHVYQEALAAAEQLGQATLLPVLQVSLAAAEMALDKSALALQRVGMALPALLASKVDDFLRFQTYLTCYQVLAANHDQRSTTILALANKQLQEVATYIEEEQLRHSFLTQIPSHRELIMLWKRSSSAN